MSSITVSGMSCHHCTDAVAKAMRGVPSAGEVTVDLVSGKASWTGSASVDEMVEAVKTQGYEVKS